MPVVLAGRWLKSSAVGGLTLILRFVASKPLRVAIVRQQYNPFGGAERFIQNAIAALAAHRAVHITVFARQWPKGVNPAFSFVRVAGRAKINWLRDAVFSWRVQAMLPPQQFDLVQSHERIPGLDVYRAGDGVHVAWLKRRLALCGGAAKWRRWLFDMTSIHHWRTCNAERDMFAHPALKAVICNSNMVRREIIDYFGVPQHKLKLIYNGVDTQAFTPASSEQRCAARQQLGLPLDAKVLLYVGSGFERKGVPYLLEALSKASAPMRPSAVAAQPVEALYCIVVGHDKHTARYQHLAQRLGVAQHMVWAGPHAQLSPYFASADAFVLPTLYDPFPNAAAEALACGLPVFVSDACGIAEWLHNPGVLPELSVQGVAGWVHPAGDVACLARQLASWLRSANKPLHQHAARTLALSLSVERMTQQLLDLYQTLLGVDVGLPAAMGDTK